MTTTKRYRDAGTGQFLTDKKGQSMPKDKVVRETIKTPPPSKKK